MSARDEAVDLLDSIVGRLDGEYDTAALTAIGYALLDVASAIREQTAEIQENGIRCLTERNA